MKIFENISDVCIVVTNFDFTLPILNWFRVYVHLHVCIMSFVTIRNDFIIVSERYVLSKQE